MSDTPIAPVTNSESSTVDPSDSWDDTPQEVNVEETDNEEGKSEPKQPKPEKKQKRYLTAKVNGKEERIDEESLLRDYQKYKAADQKFAEASKAQKSVEQFLKALQEDPETVLNDPRLSFDRKKIAEKWLYDQIQQELNPQDPRELKLRELEDKLNEYKTKEEQEQEAQEQAQYQKVVEAKRSELSNLFADAMHKSALSKNPETAAASLREMALYYRACKEQGETPNAEELAQHIEQKYYKGMYSLTESLSGEELVEFLGPQIIKKLRAYDLGKLQSKTQSFEPKSQNNDWEPVTHPNGTRKTMSPADAKDMIRNKLLGK